MQVQVVIHGSFLFVSPLGLCQGLDGLVGLQGTSRPRWPSRAFKGLGGLGGLHAYVALKGLVMPYKGLTRAFSGLYEALRLYKALEGLARPSKALMPYGALQGRYCFIRPTRLVSFLLPLQRTSQDQKWYDTVAHCV